MVGGAAAPPCSCRGCARASRPRPRTTTPPPAARAPGTGSGARRSWTATLELARPRAAPSRRHRTSPPRSSQPLRLPGPLEKPPPSAWPGSPAARPPGPLAVGVRLGAALLVDLRRWTSRPGRKSRTRSSRRTWAWARPARWLSSCAPRSRCPAPAPRPRSGRCCGPPAGPASGPTWTGRCTPSRTATGRPTWSWWSGVNGTGKTTVCARHALAAAGELRVQAWIEQDMTSPEPERKTAAASALAALGRPARRSAARRR